MKYSILTIAIAAALLLGACTTFGTGSSGSQGSTGYTNAADTSAAGAGGGAGSGAGAGVKRPQ